MDTRDDLDLARMMWDCLEYTYTHREYIEKMCDLIKKIGHSKIRQELYEKSKNEIEKDTSELTDDITQ